MTLRQQALTKAREVGIAVEDFGDGEVRAICPAGLRFDIELHERVYDYRDERKSGLWPVLLDDLNYVEPCTDPKCEWCHPETLIP